LGLVNLWSAPKPSKPKVVFANGLLSIQVENVKLKALIKEVGKKANIEISLDPDLEDKNVTVSFEDLSIEDGLKVILREAGISNQATVYRKISEEGKPQQWVIEKVYLLEKDRNDWNWEAIREMAIDESWKNYKSEKIYRNTEYGFELRYPDTLSPKESYDTYYDEYEKKTKKYLRVAFFSPQDIARSKLGKDTAFMLIFIRKINPEISLESWLQKKLHLPEFKEFKITRTDLYNPQAPNNPWFPNAALGDFLGKISIGKNKNINGYLFHTWAQNIGESRLYIKQKNLLITISSSQPEAEYSFFFKDPIATKMLDSFKFIKVQ
jgi:hypothetical protein